MEERNCKGRKKGRKEGSMKAVRTRRRKKRKIEEARRGKMKRGENNRRERNKEEKSILILQYTRTLNRLISQQLSVSPGSM